MPTGGPSSSTPTTPTPTSTSAGCCTNRGSSRKPSAITGWRCARAPSTPRPPSTWGSRSKTWAARRTRSTRIARRSPRIRGSPMRITTWRGCTRRRERKRRRCGTSPATGDSPATNSAPRRSRWGRRKQCRELLRQLRPDARCFVLEEDERVLPPFPQRLHRLDPLLEILVLVALVAQPHVAEVGGGDERRMALLRVRDAQRRVRDPQCLVHVVRQPRRVTELQGATQVSRELGEEIVQPIQILLEVGRQLEQDRSEERRVGKECRSRCAR